MKYSLSHPVLCQNQSVIFHREFRDPDHRYGGLPQGNKFGALVLVHDLYRVILVEHHRDGVCHEVIVKDYLADFSEMLEFQLPFSVALGSPKNLSFIQMVPAL